jgi:hypothetical protein
MLRYQQPKFSVDRCLLASRQRKHLLNSSNQRLRGGGAAMITQRQYPSRDKRWVSSKRQSPFAKPKSGSKSTCTPIRVNGKVVGEVSGDIFTKRLRGSVHFLHYPPAISFDIASLREAEDAGARSVKVVDTESKRVYLSPISTIWTKGFEIDRGYGRQIALVIELWSRGDKQADNQLSLWR